MKIGSMRYFNRERVETVIPHPAVVSTSLLGVEIELENALQIYNDKGSSFGAWTLKSDGSLRNGGIEFVLTRPLGGAKLAKALSDITTMLAEYQPDKSWRCSTHVHINIKDFTVAQLKRLILTMTVFEKVMFKCGAQNRYKNNFCIPYDVAQEQILTLSDYWDLDGSEFIDRVSRRWSKYSSLNLKPMTTLGSVELRIGNAETEFDELLSMCNRLLTLKALAADWEGDDEGYVQLLASIPFNNIFNKSICLDYEVNAEDIERGVKNAMDILTLKSIRTSMSDSVRFTTILEQSRVDDYMNYAVDNYSEEYLDENIYPINWNDMSLTNVTTILGCLPISVDSLLNEHDVSVYQTMVM